MPYRRNPTEPFTFRFPQARTPLPPKPTYTPNVPHSGPIIRPRSIIPGTYPGTNPNDRKRREWLEMERMRRMAQMRRGW